MPYQKPFDKSNHFHITSPASPHDHTGVGKEQEIIGRIKRETQMSNTSVLLPAKPQPLQSHGHIVASDLILGLVAGFDTT